MARASRQRHVSPIDGPLVILFEHQGSDEADDGLVVGKDPDDVGAPLDLLVDPFQRVGNRYEIRGADGRLRSFEHGVWCDHPGQRHREHEGAGRPVHSMSCELVLVAGRLCDSPGCAESADP